MLRLTVSPEEYLMINDMTIFIASASTFKMNLGSSRIAFIQLFR